MESECCFLDAREMVCQWMVCAMSAGDFVPMTIREDLSAQFEIPVGHVCEDARCVRASVGCRDVGPVAPAMRVTEF